jgi:hypothetical protein
VTTVYLVVLVGIPGSVATAAAIRGEPGRVSSDRDADALRPNHSAATATDNAGCDPTSIERTVVILDGDLYGDVQQGNRYLFSWSDKPVLTTTAASTAPARSRSAAQGSRSRLAASQVIVASPQSRDT